jgi:hypothetical protein
MDGWYMYWTTIKIMRLFTNMCAHSSNNSSTVVELMSISDNRTEGSGITERLNLIRFFSIISGQNLFKSTLFTIYTMKRKLN